MSSGSFFLLFLHLLFLLNDGSVYKENKVTTPELLRVPQEQVILSHTANLSAGSQGVNYLKTTGKIIPSSDTAFHYEVPATPRNLLDDTESSQGVFPNAKCTSTSTDPQADIETSQLYRKAC